MVFRLTSSGRSSSAATRSDQPLSGDERPRPHQRVVGAPAHGMHEAVVRREPQRAVRVVLLLVLEEAVRRVDAAAHPVLPDPLQRLWHALVLQRNK